MHYALCIKAAFSALGLPLWKWEVHDAAGVVACLAGLDLAKVSLILVYVLLQGVEQLLGVLGGHDDAALHACLGGVRSHKDHVHHEVVG